ncbi:hypothetical protein LNP74_26290 [Klebsiella pneumoniae subsp. pneumoniae]|nr:hypothetical protein [Klebsiella pneumoniae subsp. pneumoniae]
MMGKPDPVRRPAQRHRRGAEEKFSTASLESHTLLVHSPNGWQASFRRDEGKLGLACTRWAIRKYCCSMSPASASDPISRRELWQMVHELAGDGMLILWSTSYLDEAEQMPRRAADERRPKLALPG